MPAAANTGAAQSCILLAVFIVVQSLTCVDALRLRVRHVWQGAVKHITAKTDTLSFASAPASLAELPSRQCYRTYHSSALDQLCRY